MPSTHDIYNPWHGCRRISEGCAHCYMMWMDKQWDKDGTIISKTKTDFNYPLKKSRNGEYKIKAGERIRVCMTSDFFLEEADPWRNEVWEMLKYRSDVIWYLLTKRAERIEQCLPADWGEGYENIQLGVTTENQARADQRIPILLNVPAKHKHLCAAPFIGPLNIEPYLAAGQIEFIQAGGENYDGSRICRYDWALSLYQQCARTNVDFIFYETGSKFEKDGRIYFMPNKQLQSSQAFWSGLSYPSTTKPEYKLYLPGTDTPVPPEQLHKPVFLRPQCQVCAARRNCNGCSNCGKCDKKRNQ